MCYSIVPNFHVFRGSISNLENLARENFHLIMHIRRDIYGIHKNCFHEISKTCKSLKI